MTSPRLFAFITVVVVLAGLLLLGHRMLLSQRAQLTNAQQRTENLNRELAARNRAREATVSELALAERQLAQLSPVRMRATTSSSGGGGTEFAPWIARVKRLQKIMEHHPDQRIPELQLLTDDDWLVVVRRNMLNSEEDVRQALAAIRTAAKDRVVASLTEATRRFNVAATPDQTVALPRPGRGGAPGNGGVTTARTPPVKAMDLAPYLQNPADAAVLSRLAIFSNGSGWKLQEIDPIDPDYDGGYRIISNAGGVSGGVSRAPWAWLPPDFDERSLRANQAYQAAHNGLRSPDYEETLRYFDPPLESAIAEKILKAERERVK